MQTSVFCRCVHSGWIPGSRSAVYTRRWWLLASKLSASRALSRSQIKLKRDISPDRQNNRSSSSTSSFSKRSFLNSSVNESLSLRLYVATPSGEPRSALACRRMKYTSYLPADVAQFPPAELSTRGATGLPADHQSAPASAS